MRDVVILFLHLIVTVVRLARPGGLRSVVAESLLVKHQLRILNRGRKRAPNLRATERIIAGLCTLLMNPACVLRSAIVMKPVVSKNVPGPSYPCEYSPLGGRSRAPVFHMIWDLRTAVLTVKCSSYEV